MFECFYYASLVWYELACLQSLICFLDRGHRRCAGKASVRHLLQPLCDLSASKIAEVAEESQLGFCSWSATGRWLIGDWLPTDQRPRGDLFATWCNWLPTGPRLVANQVNLRFCKTAITWLRSLSDILSLFWRHGIANFPAFAAKTWEMLLWRHEIHYVFPQNWAIKCSTIFQWNLIFSLLTRLGTPIF